jgi:hypothetical protein
MSQFITINRADPTIHTHAGRLLSIAQQVKTLRDSLETMIDETYQMLDGDGSQAAHYTVASEKYGTATTAEAKTCFELMNGMKQAIDASNDAELGKRIG